MRQLSQVLVDRTFCYPPPSLFSWGVGRQKSCPQAPVIDSGYIKPIISSMLWSVEFLTPHTGLLIFYSNLLPRNVNYKSRKKSAKSRDLGRL